MGKLPRVHDMRHSFALHALLRWYRNGDDVQVKLPSLSAYMGHASVASTQLYLTWMEPLVKAASELYEEHSRPLLGTCAAGGGQ